MGARRRGRELALQALYQVTFGGHEDPGRSLAEFWGHAEAAAASAEARTFGAALAAGAWAERQRIDALIAASAEHWRLGRLAQVDLNILRVATYELLQSRDVPAQVAIDEAIEIAKRFGSADSAVFVNGVLDQIATAVGAKDGRGAV